MLNPKKKMGHFKKNWASSLVTEVEELVKKHVRSFMHRDSRYALQHSVAHLFQFLERYNEHNKKYNSMTTQTRKTMPPSSKPGRCNVDDTDSESDGDDCQQVDATNSWIDEWKLYIDTNEVVPDEMGIVRWWGVRISFSCYNTLIQYLYFRYMEAATQHGSHLHVITLQ